mmetsp:Transcript_16830/g.47997  ORF Transcript_16830/g.47997 Transcript_16830/m.47997 type:complete len:224 (+) Transcript_16830:774-1445(+)
MEYPSVSVRAPAACPDPHGHASICLYLPVAASRPDRRVCGRYARPAHPRHPADSPRRSCHPNDLESKLIKPERRATLYQVGAAPYVRHQVHHLARTPRGTSRRGERACTAPTRWRNTCSHPTVQTNPPLTFPDVSWSTAWHSHLLPSAPSNIGKRRTSLGPCRCGRCRWSALRFYDCLVAVLPSSRQKKVERRRRAVWGSRLEMLMLFRQHGGNTTQTNLGLS